MTLSDDPRLGLPSASSFHLDVACPARQNTLREMRAKGVPIIEDPALKELGESGTRIHKARETGHVLNLSEKEIEIYKKGMEGESRIVDLWQRDNDISVVMEGPPEERFWINHPDNLLILASAQIDRHYLAPPHLLIIDWKSFFAPWVPPSNRNWQLRISALAAIQEYEEIEKIRVALNKPMAFGEKIDYTDLTRHDLKRIEEVVLSVCWASSQPDAVHYPGPHCFRCQANSACPAAASYASMPVMTLNPDPESLVALMTPAELAKVWKVRPQIKTVMESIQARLETFTEAELAAVGLKRTRGRKNDSINNVAGVAELLKGELALTDKELHSAMDFTNAALVALVARQKNLSEDDAKKWLDAKLDPFLTRDRAKPSIVLE